MDMAVNKYNSNRMVEEELSQVMDNYSLRDVVLYSNNGKVVRIHRWMLSAASSFLSGLMINIDPYQTRDQLEIYLPDFNCDDLTNLASFLYNGQVMIKQRSGGQLRHLLALLRIDIILNKETVRQSDCSSNLPTRSEDIGQHSNRKCDECSKIFKTNLSLMKHRRIFHKAGIKMTNLCEFCDKPFSSKENLINHRRSHTGELFVCNECPKTFQNERDFQDHQNIHTLKISYLCSDCGKVFQTNKSLLNHKEKHKLNDQPCPVCGKLILTLASYKSHMRAHGQERAFSCPVCGKSFKRNFDLTVHSRIHTGDKPYKCEQCDKSFSLSSSLSKHRKHNHKHQLSCDISPCM